MATSQEPTTKLKPGDVVQLSISAEGMAQIFQHPLAQQHIRASSFGKYYGMVVYCNIRTFTEVDEEGREATEKVEEASIALIGSNPPPDDLFGGTKGLQYLPGGGYQFCVIPLTPGDNTTPSQRSHLQFEGNVEFPIAPALLHTDLATTIHLGELHDEGPRLKLTDGEYKRYIATSMEDRRTIRKAVAMYQASPEYKNREVEESALEEGRVEQKEEGDDDDYDDVPPVNYIVADVWTNLGDAKELSDPVELHAEIERIRE